jgi:streptomycin 6-kinase
MIRVPEAFAAWAGRAWVRSLPSVVEGLVGRWGLEVDEAEALHGTFGIVVLVRRGDQPLALKVSRPGDTTADVTRALRAWDGRGVMRLVDDDPGSGALLLERLDHARSLHALPLWEAAEVAGALIRRLAVPAPAGLHTLRDVAAGISGQLPGRQRALGDPVPAAWVRAACRYADELGPAGERVLIHADLHYGNILGGVREPWLATDPRPLLGAPEYSVPEMMWNRADDLRTDADVRRLLRVLTRAGGLDHDAARGWVVARCVDYWLWGLEHGLTIDPPRCERVLTALA